MKTDMELNNMRQELSQLKKTAKTAADKKAFNKKVNAYNLAVDEFKNQPEIKEQAKRRTADRAFNREVAKKLSARISSAPKVTIGNSEFIGFDK